MADVKEYLKTAGLSFGASLIFFTLYYLIARFALKDPKDKISGMIAILFIVIFLFFFYFFYITKLESDHAVSDINYGMNTLSDEIMPLLSDDTISIASDEINKFNIKDMSGEDAKEKKINNDLLQFYSPPILITLPDFVTPVPSILIALAKS